MRSTPGSSDATPVQRERGAGATGLGRKDAAAGGAEEDAAMVGTQDVYTAIAAKERTSRRAWTRFFAMIGEMVGVSINTRRRGRTAGVVSVVVGARWEPVQSHNAPPTGDGSPCRRNEFKS